MKNKYQVSSFKFQVPTSNFQRENSKLQNLRDVNLSFKKYFFKIIIFIFI